MSQKVVYTTHDGRFTVEFDYDPNNTIAFFEAIASFQEVFEFNECHTKDGKERSSQVQFVVRENQGNTYYEARCIDSSNKNLYGARKQFGQHKNGKTLFPKRAPQGSFWTKWNGQEEEEL